MALLHERISMKNLWRISQNFLHTCHSSSILLCISSKNMWKICEEYVTVYCLKFYIISNKFKSVWIYLKLWRILLNTIEIWTNLKGLTNTKRSKMKNREKEREREFFMNMVGEKKQGGFTRLLSWNTNGYLFRQMQQEKYNMKTCK